MLDVTAGIVWHGDRRVELRPQSFAVLEHLVRHGGELVTREDLLDAVWGDRVVTDASITQCIGDIRAALGEPGQDMLRTVPRRGYRLEAEVTTGAPSVEPNDVASRSGRPFRIATGVATVLTLAAVAWFALRDDGTGPAAPNTERPGAAVSEETGSGETGGAPGDRDSRPSLAVLPFAYRGVDDDRDFLAEGLHDDLLTSLARSANLRVISRTSVMPYADTDQSVREIGQALGVGHVLEGSVEVRGSDLRVVVQLIEAGSDTHLWAETYDRDLAPKSIFALRDELSQAIASALETRLDVTPKRSTDSRQALEAYHRGLQLLHASGVENLQAAADHFRRAAETDPEFADAWVGYADSQTVLAETGAVTQQDSWPRREEAIERALAVDPEHAGAHAARGWLHYHRVRTFPEEAAASEAAFLRAIELKPNDARAHMGYALLLNLAYPLRISEAVDLLEKAQRLNPGSKSVAINLAATYRFWGILDPAERLLLDVLERDPTYGGARRALARLYLDWGRLAAAQAQAQEAAEIDSRDVGHWALVGEIALELRDLDRAAEVLEELRNLAPGHPATLVLEVKLLDRAGERASVRTRLDAALERLGPIPDLIDFGVFHLLLAGDVPGAARWQQRRKLLEDETAWPGLIRLKAEFLCAMGWLAGQSGRPEAGGRLVAASRAYLVETLPASRDHVDRYKPDVCHLAAGDTDAALASIEQQAGHRHIALWDEWHRLPLYDAIRHEPRYLAAVSQRERWLREEREKAGLEGPGTPPPGFPESP